MNSADLKELIDKNKEELFSEISDEIDNEKVTDIEWDGYNLWITELGIGSYISGKELSDKYVENISIKLANIMGVQFNRSRPILEANTENLRISIWHESRCQKKSMAIRKIPEYLRFDHNMLVKSDYYQSS
jgi:pilus assembly protein CpaF